MPSIAAWLTVKNSTNRNATRSPLSQRSVAHRASAALLMLGKKDEPGAQPETGSSAKQDQTSESKPCGHGRNGADAFESARKVETQHQQLKSGDSCPECPTGKVYVQKEPKTLIRIVASYAKLLGK